MSDKKDDLTRLEDLSEFMHEQDEEDEEEFVSTQEEADLDEPEELAAEPEEDFFATTNFDENSEDDDATELEALAETSFDEPEELLDEPEPEPVAENIMEMTDSGEFPESTQELTMTETVTHLQPAPMPVELPALTGKQMTYGKISYGGNPPFSLKLTQLDDPVEKKEVLDLIKNHGLVTPEIEANINRGTLLISHVSEYVAVYLTHKLRHLKAQLKVGLSRDVYPSDQYDDSDERGSPDPHYQPQFDSFKRD